MAIFFKPLGSLAGAFDTDNILLAVDKDGVKRFENVPCHLVLTRNDNPATGNTVAGAPVPVVVFAEVYTPLSVNIMEGDRLTVEKRGADGAIIQTYYGKAGVPSATQSRKVTVLQITSVVQPVPPRPPVTVYSVSVLAPNGYGGMDFVEAGNVRFDTGRAADGEGSNYRADYVVFLDGWKFTESGVYFKNPYLEEFAKVGAGSHMKIMEEARTFVLEDSPVKTGETWSALVRFSA